MINLGILPIPNQSLSAVLDGIRYEVTLKETGGVMSASILKDDVLVLDNIRIVAGTPFIPYFYLESGNFFILTENEDMPDYTKFGSSQSLIYLTMAEIEAINAGT